MSSIKKAPAGFLTVERKTILISWALWFAGIFATFLLGAVKANLDAGMLPPLTVTDLLNALWAAVGAGVAVAIQYLDKKYTRYGVSASTADEAAAVVAPDAPAATEE